MLKSLRSTDLKESNRISILNLIRNEECSRALISAKLGMSRPAVSVLVDELIQENLVKEIGYGKPGEGGGKRPVLLRFNQEAGRIVSIYMNEEWFEVGIADLSMNMIKHIKQKTTIHSDYRLTLDEVIGETLHLIQSSMLEAKHIPVIACGLTMRGLVDVRNGKLRYSSNIANWRDIPVKQYFSEKLSLPIFIENDARAKTLVELLDSDHRNVLNLICINVGIGIGTGAVINGDIYRGANDGAVNLGHTTVLEGGPLCTCGNRGCLEALASTSAFVKELVKRDERFKEVDFNAALAKYMEGDPLVRDVLLNHTCHWLGVGIGNIMNLFNPERVIIQGEITMFGEEARAAISDLAKQRASKLERQAEIYFTNFSDQLHIRGGIAVVVKHFFSLEHHGSIWEPVMNR